MNVVASTVSQPTAAMVHTATRATGWPTSQTTPSIVRHWQHSRPSAALAASTNVLRSTGGGTILVHHRLNHGLAMMLCWAAKTPSSARFTAMAGTSGAAMPWSTVRGTTIPSTNNTA